MSSLVVFSLGIAACGGGGANGPVQGPFIRVGGAQHRTLSLDSGDLQVSCTVKPGPREFEYTAEKPGQYKLHIFVPDFDGPTDLDISYGPANAQHKFELELDGGFKYQFFQHFRGDTNERFVSSCLIKLENETPSRPPIGYSGYGDCSLLFSAPGSADYAGSASMNTFVDAAFRIDCGDESTAAP
ncbi:MAG: hypothetical protein H6707_08860 [Deltaproteobacteria bacterium]|nr:hypothetical protein [Deltaproteobacteria bacterium]